MSDKSGRGVVGFSLLGLLWFNAISSFAGGLALVIRPDGDIIGIPVDVLEGTIFSNFLIPGIILFVIVGSSSLWGALAVQKQSPGERLMAILAGLILVIWIVVEALMIGYNPLQLIYGIVGMLITALALSRSEIHNIKDQKQSRD